MKIINEINRFFVVIMLLVIAYFICKYTPYYLPTTVYAKDTVRVVLDDNEITNSLPDIAMIIDGKVMLSIDTIKKYINEYIYFDEKYDTIIVAHDTYFLKMPVNSKSITINGEQKEIQVPAQRVGEKLYVPIEEIATIYNVQVKYNEKVVLTTGTIQYYKVSINNKIHVKKYKQELCLTTDVVKESESIEIFDDYTQKDADDYLWVRTENGSFGYVKKSNIKTKDEVLYSTSFLTNPEDKEKKKISLAWEYAENYTPNRTNETKIASLDIVAPTWIYVKNINGDVRECVSSSYIRWTEDVGYEVWPTIKNDEIGIEKTSLLLNDLTARENFISQIIDICKDYNFKGINLDFEHIYFEDREEYAELVRELCVMLRINGITSSVDVNVPDGADDWSKCFDSKAISEATDYIIVMAYDQYNTIAGGVGPVASLEWVEMNLNKMLKRDGIDNKKLILGVPFYSRMWKERNGNVTATEAIYMKAAKNYMASKLQNTVWDDNAGQYITKYNQGNTTITIYVEDKNSLEKKIELVNKYDLAGVAAWRLGQETTDVWQVMEEMK